MPGSVAETVYGRQGGGWAPTVGQRRHGIRVDVPVEGGELAKAGLPSLAMWTFGEEPELLAELTLPGAPGRYVLVGGECSPPVPRKDEFKVGDTETWSTDGRYVWEPAS